MPSRDIKTRFVLEGEQEYKRAMTDSANAIKTLNSEQRLAKAEFEATGDAQQYAADQARILKEQIQHQQRAVQAAEDAIKKLTENGVDKNSKQMQQWRTKLNNAKTSLTQMQTRLNKVEGELGEESTAFGKAETSANSYQEEVEKVNKGIDFQNTITAIDNITDHIERVVKAAARAAKAVWDMGVDAGTWADNIATAASQMGVDPETYQSWQYASRFIDTSVEDIEKSWQDIQKNLDETNLDFLGSLAEMGIASRTTAGTMRNSSDIFWDAIDYLHGIGDSSLQAQEATKLFRNDWRRLMPLIQAGSGAYKELADEGRSVAVVSNDNVAALGGVDDAVQDFQARLDKFKFDALAALAPTFEQTAKALSQAVTAMDEFVQSEEGQAALTELSNALTSIIDSFLGTDGGKGSFESIVNTARDAVTNFTSAMEWISKNGDTIVKMLEGMGIAWAGLKVTKEVLLFMQLLKSTPISKLSEVFNGSSAAAAAKSAAAGGAAGAAPKGAAGGGIFGKIGSKLGGFLTSAAGKALGGVGIGAAIVLTPTSTADDEQDTLYHDDGSLTEAGREAEANGTFADAVNAAAEATKAMAEAAEQMGMSETEYSQMLAAQKYWDNIRTNGITGNSAVIAGGEFHSAFIGEEKKFADLTTKIREFIASAGSSWTEIEDLPEEWFTVGTEAVDTLKEAIDDGAADVSTAANDAAVDAVTSADAGFSGMRTAGQAAASGLAQGLYDRAGEVEAAAGFISGRATNMVMTTLQIHSPSKVFERLGEYTAQGYADGINAQASAVQRAVAHMASATTVPVAAMAGAGAALGAASGGAGGHMSESERSMINATVVMDKVVVGHMIAPVINDTIGAVVSAERD